jgi:hypothetical protein
MKYPGLKSDDFPLQTETSALGRSSEQPFLFDQAPHRVTWLGTSVEPNPKPRIDFHLSWIS